MIQPVRLAIGETLVILYPDIIHTVQPGDTLVNIAAKYGVPVMQLLRNNPYLSDREYIYPGEEIVISYEGEKVRLISANGYAFPFIDLAVLRKTLPFLTYLTVFGYQVSADGSIGNIDDKAVILTAKAYGVAPIMTVFPAAKNQEEAIAVIHTLLTEQDIQDRFFNNLINILKEKGYYGVSLITPYISPDDRIHYDQFVLKYASLVSMEGFKAFNTFYVRLFELLTGELYSGIDYSTMGKVLDGITLISFEFGTVEGVPPGTVSVESIRRFLNSVVEIIPPEKISIEIQDIGYVWQLPYNPATSKGRAVSYEAAVETARNTNSVIHFDETTYSAYFNYIYSDEEYIVRFWDARSVDGFVRMVPEYKLDGIAVWNIMTYFPQMWLVINSQYDIEKVLLK